MPANEQIQRLERLLEVSRNLSASMEVDAFLQSVLSAASELTASEVASILEPDEEGAQLRFLALPWFHRDLLRSVKVPLEASIAGWVFQNVKPLLVPDVASDPRHYKGVDLTAEFQTRSILAVPIIYKGEVLGVLEAVNKANQGHYTGEERAFLETLASLAAVAMQNTRQMSKIQKSFDETNQLDQMKSDFIAIASHELRTPLGLILGHATSLREAIGEKHHPELDIIVRNALSLKEIIDSIANMDNVRRGIASIRRRPFSVRRLVEEAIDSFHEEALQKGISMRVEFGNDDPSAALAQHLLGRQAQGSSSHRPGVLPGGQNLMVECDASKIAIVLNNLVKNAIAFTDSGGHILILVEQIPAYIKFSVIDDGIGISAKDLSHIFERFYQVESHLTRRHGGLGLGLSVARLMVELHGGRIWAESVEGKGSNFSFILPYTADQAQAANKVFIT
ncbi:MAG: GAF domain-containing protein [Chloroflexi bacterium]|nr:GAF domain-containing protein [Chloroflexota bacterium]